MLGLVRNILALVGLVAVLAGGYMYASHGSKICKFSSFDPKAGEVYKELVDKLLETGNAAEATVWKSKVKEGLTFAEVDQSIKSVANELNIKDVGQLPLADGLTGHGLRHGYANDRYEQIAGQPSPVRGGTAPDRHTDQAARLEVAEELGHSRASVTTHYLGR